MEEGRLVNGAFLQKLREKQQRGWQRHFTLVPREWETRLLETKQVAAYRLAHELLYQHWQNGGKPITVSGGTVKGLKLPRWAKTRALVELERLGLIEVEQSPRKAPRVIL